MTATLFDFDGVLVDTEPAHLAAFREVLAPLDIGVTDEDYYDRYLGYDDVGAFRAMLEDAGRAPNDDEVRALVSLKAPVLMRSIETSLSIFPGAADIVRRRAAKGPVGIVSGALAPEIAFCLDRMGVADFVQFVVSAERCTACKPDPEGYLLAVDELAKLGATREETVVIEDSIGGIEAAKAAGLRCVAIAHSHGAAELLRAGADAAAADLASLTDALLDGERAR